MRPKLLTPRKLILALLAFAVSAAMVVWLRGGSKIALIDSVPSTAGKIAWVRNGDLFMADAQTGANPATLTTGDTDDDEPAWSPGGDTLALTSNRNGVSRQVYVMNAVPGAKPGVLTNSSTSKAAPFYGTADDIYFLDGGKIAKITPKTADVDAVFPTAEQKRKVLSELFGAGGVARFAVSPDGERFFVAVTRERGEALVMYTAAGEVVAFGLAEKILFRYLPDGSVVAVFVGGAPFPKPNLLMNAEAMKNPEFVAPSLPMGNESDENIVVRIGMDFSIKPLTPVPFVPTGLAVSPDGTKVGLTGAGKTSQTQGVFVFPLDGSGGGRVAALAATEPAFSPGGDKIAFVSGNDVFVAAATPGGSAAPVNLTKGAGVNTAPAWSPVKP